MLIYLLQGKTNCFMKKLAALVCMLLTVWFSVSAQTSGKFIKGHVSGENNEPLVGASVMIAGSKKGVQTDKNGDFTLPIPNNENKYNLVISYVGYTSQTIEAKATGMVNVKLSRTNDVGNEVVVIGYQSVKRKDLLASVSSVGAKDLKDIPINSAAEALAGRLAGVQITSSEGSPDANITIRVRGGGSITQDNSPLYIVDGVQVENALATLAPQDIQSIDVLKDAAATAIYGARGANGVVIITTKGGRQGKLRMSYNGFVGLEKLAKELPVMSPWEFIRWNYERSRNNTTDSATFAKTYGTTWDTLSVYKSIPPVDWQKLVLGRNGMLQTNNVSVNGGNSKTTFNLSYTNNTDITTVLNSKYYRNIINLRVDQRIGKKIKVGGTLRYLNQNVYGAGTSSPNGSTYNRLRNTVKYRPFLSPNITSPDVIDPSLVDNSTGNGLFLVNPIALSNAEYRKKTTDGFNFSGYASYQITKNLTFRTTFGYDYNHYINRQYSDSISPLSIIQGGAKPVVELDTINRTSINNSNVFTYSLKNLKGKHDIDFLLGQETYQVRTESEYNLFKSIPTFTPINKAFTDLSLGTSFTGYPKQIITNYTSLSFFGRINYAYLQKYLFSVNMRADASSKFAPDMRWGYFPAASAAWRVKKEKFMKTVKFINDMKLRVGYGAVGNNRIADYLYLDAFNNNVNYYGINNQTIYAYTSASLVNPYLKWETTINRNLGLDLSLFNDRIQFTVDYYSNSTKNLLLNVPVASTYGYSTQLQNVGKTTNKGVEFQISSLVVQKKNFTWNANFNLSFNQNRVVALAKGQTSFLQSAGWGVSGQPADYIIQVGSPVGAMYGFVTDGFYKVSDFDYNPTTQTYTLKQGVVSDASIIGNPQPGSLKLKDLNGDGVVDLDHDRKILGTSQPKFFGGLNQQFSYKNFDMSIFVNFVYGNSVYNANKIEFSNGYVPNSNLLAIMDNRFTNIDANGNTVKDPTQLAALNANAKIWSPLISSGAFYLHSWAIEDGSFLRINNITLGYTLAPKALRKLKINRLRFYTTLNNVAILTGYSGYDPEVSVSQNLTTPGLDYSAFPKSKTYIFGVNVIF